MVPEKREASCETREMDVRYWESGMDVMSRSLYVIVPDCGW